MIKSYIKIKKKNVYFLTDIHNSTQKYVHKITVS